MSKSSLPTSGSEPSTTPSTTRTRILLTALGAVGGALLTGVITLTIQSRIELQKAQLERQLEQQKEQFQTQLELEKMQFQKSLDSEKTSSEKSAEVQKERAEVQERQLEKQIEDAREKTQAEIATNLSQAEFARTGAEQRARAEDAARARFQQHLIAAYAQENRLDSHFSVVRFENRGTTDAQAAVYYKAIDGLWVTSGWFTVRSGKTANSNATTQNPILYYYVKKFGGQSCVAEDEAEFVWKPIADEEFDHLDNDILVGAPSGQVKFRRWDAKKTDGAPVTISIACN